MSSGIDLAEASLELEIIEPEDEYGCSISIELDDDLNGGRSCFGPGEEFWIRVYSPVIYDLFLTGGGIKQRQTNIYETIPNPDDPEVDEWEYVNFANWSGSASKPIAEIIINYWCFHTLGTVRWSMGYSEMSVLKPSDSTDLGYGVLRMQYKSKFDRFLIRAPQEGHDIKIVVFSTDPDQLDCKSELQVQIRESCDTQRPKEITVQAEDCETQNGVQGASAYVNNEFRGTTDASGNLYLGLLSPGTYKIRWEHPDYWPSENDGVVNDEFVVD